MTKNDRFVCVIVHSIGSMQRLHKLKHRKFKKVLVEKRKETKQNCFFFRKYSQYWHEIDWKPK